MFVKRSKGVNLITQMLCQRVREIFDEFPDLLPTVIFGRTRPSVLVEQLKAGRERSMLFDVAGHEALDSRKTLHIWEEVCLFDLVMMVHGKTPALAVRQEVPDSGKILRGNIGRL